MYLSRLLLNPRSKEVRRDQADCHVLHARVMAAFPQASSGNGARSEYSVLFRVDRGTNPVLYVQSAEPPDWSSLPHAYLLYHGKDNPACKSVAKQYECLRSGMVLRFRLRANPTKKIETKTGPDGRRCNGKRVDIQSEEDQIKWLMRKGQASGFELMRVLGDGDVVDVRVLQEPKVEGVKASDPQSKPMTFGSVLYEGHLRIVDHSLFLHAVKSGIGPGKAYGFGLLSLAPPY